MFDRLIWVVIDALRFDFVTGAKSGFDYVNTLVDGGKVQLMNVYAHGPTVTMPRIKVYVVFWLI